MLLSVRIRGFLNAVFFQFPDQHIQLALPEDLKPILMAKQSNQRGAYSIVKADKQPPRNTVSEYTVTEPPQDPDFVAIIGAVYACRDIAPLLIRSLIPADPLWVASPG
jgi:hypothetical protein